jgi:phosphotransferase system enzyme I (PtsP)
MALIGIGYRCLSMAPASIGPVKAMILSLDARRLEAVVKDAIGTPQADLRQALLAFAKAHGVAI